MRPAPLIEGRQLTKRFGDFVAVDGVDFRVEQGEAFGFLGPNGAGKTSTMRMIGCISPVSDGELRVLGMDPATDGTSIRARLGVVPQEDTLDLELTVRDNVLIYGRYFDLPRNVVGEPLGVAFSVGRVHEDAIGERLVALANRRHAGQSFLPLVVRVEAQLDDFSRRVPVDELAR